MSKLTLETHYLSESAIYHKVNKDNYGAFSGDFGKVYIVARGFGQEEAHLISDLVVVTLKNFFEKQPFKYDAVLTLKLAVQVASKEVLSYLSEHRWLSECGATVAMLLFSHNGVYIANIGDCRVLLLRRNRITCLNSTKEAHCSLSTAYQSSLDPEIIENVKLYKDDCVLLTTKGVYQRVTRQEIVQAMSKQTIKDGITALWNYAKTKNVPEDFTVVAVKVLKAQPLPKENTTTPQDIRRFWWLLAMLICCLGLLYFTFYPYLSEIGLRY